MAAKIIANLKIMGDMERLHGNTYKARAYDKVVIQLSKLSPDVQKNIKTVQDVEAAGVSGIGKSIEKKIIEILNTGELKAAAKAREYVSIYEEISKVHGIGHAKAMELINAGIRSIDDLRSNPDRLNDTQKKGLLYYDSFQKRIPRKEMIKHENILQEYFGELFNVSLAGSFRRGATSSGDIDLLITPLASIADAMRVFHSIVNKMQREMYITDILALGPKKCMAVVKLPRHRTHRRLDILLTPHEEYPYALLYFTGSQSFNISMRNEALKKGYTLNEHSLKPTKQNKALKPPFLQTENDIFDFLGIPFVEPQNRQ